MATNGKIHEYKGNFKDAAQRMEDGRWPKETLNYYPSMRRNSGRPSETEMMKQATAYFLTED
jgi:hypothetical protein